MTGPQRFDVVVVGTGPGGYVAAIRCAQLGLTVAAVEDDRPGGVCLNWGCIPTKALLRNAEIVGLFQRAQEFGVSVTDWRADYPQAIQRSRRVADRMAKGVEFLFRKNKIALFPGTGSLAQRGTVHVTGKEGAQALEAKAIILATGSEPKSLPEVAIDETRVVSSNGAVRNEAKPGSLIIIGAGAVGMEFANIFSAFGTTVTLIEALPRILPFEDAEASDALAKSYKKRGIEVIAGAKVKKGTPAKDKVTLEVEANGATRKIEVAAVLMAAGRAVNTENIGLAECGVQVSERGFIKVDPGLQTTAPGYYAIGDVAGPPMLAHKGMREGVNVTELVAGKKPHAIRYDNVPSVTYCHPEVASIGLTEEQCKEQKLEYVAGRFPFSANGRARGTGETEGFVKILRDKKYGEILGAHIVGGHASEIIHELAVARENEYTVEEVELAIHAHPTMSEAVAQAALDSLGRVVDM